MTSGGTDYEYDQNTGQSSHPPSYQSSGAMTSGELEAQEYGGKMMQAKKKKSF